MSVAEIEAAIKTLPKEELARFNQWYQEYLDEHWDEQIRQDVRAGKLDFLTEEAQRERDAGTLRPFP
jgi:predicted Ser/Thr protein kinase